MAYYNFFVAFHLISLIVWITSTVYIFRLILLQIDEKNEFLLKEGFMIYNQISSFSFLFTICFGLILIFLNKSILETGIWIYIKFFLVSIIILIHHLSKIYLNKIDKNIFTKDKKYIKYMSFLPLILMSLIILLTITKPF
ncbi:CopD family protein [Aliarcobacter butzleri]|uniref:CopD family protein n=2 Tax=Aliarcobacter butzleri TaxID=28197 RepID=UPI00263EC2C2|nr:CopD family protein [Aliarcobacter butzleri]MDN5110766.1 CopD family protein [Aliarcobacter butzleri]